MKKSLESVIKFFIYATFFVPLIVAPNSFIFPFIVPKILLFRSLMTVVIGGYVLLLLINWQEYRPKFTWLNVALGLFLLSFTLSTFLGTDWYHSFWDNHERMLGLFTIFHYVALYLVSTSVFKNWKEWQLLLRIFLIAGSLVMIIGLMQVGDPYLLLNQGGDRIASTLGNPIYVGGYGLFLTFVSYLLVIREKERGFWFYAEIIMGLMAVLGLFFSGSRGAVLGLLAGIGFGIIGYIIVLKEYKRIRQSLIATLLLILAIIGLLISFRKTQFVSNLPAIGRTVNTTLTSLEASPRWMAWQIALESWTERPIFGWGPNNFFYAFNKYYNPKLLEHGYSETWFDNAHNIIVNTIAVQGAFGIITYLFIFVVAIFVLWKNYKNNELNYHVVIVGSAFLIAHLTQNVTVFENPTSYLYFMVWLGFINSQVWTNKIVNSPLEGGKGLPATLSLARRAGVSSGNNTTVKQFNNEKQSKPDKAIGYSSLSVTGVLCLIVMFIFNLQPARANSNTLNAIRTLSSNPALAVGDMEIALNFSSPHIDDIRADIARNVSQSFNSLYQKLGIEKATEILDLTILHLDKNLTLHPLDIRNQMTLSQLVRLKAVITKDVKYMLQAENLLKDSLNKSPKRQQVIFSLAAIETELGKNEEAIKLYKQAIQDDPVISESYWRLAYTYNSLGQKQKAKEVINDAYQKNVKFSSSDEGIISEILSSTSTNTQ